jgi:hypothetical protein
MLWWEGRRVKHQPTRESERRVLTNSNLEAVQKVEHLPVVERPKTVRKKKGERRR